MKSFVNITMPNGASYQIPSFVIFNNVVAYRITKGDTEEAARKYADERLSDDEELLEWLVNNMNWSDVAAFARMTGYELPDMQDQFMSATHKTATDDALPPIDINNGDVLSYPVEAVLTNLSAHQQVAASLIISGPDDSIDYQLALTVVQGPASVVQGYIAVSQQFTNFLRDKANSAAAAVDKAEGTNLPTTH